ncbi:electron transport complex subunit RsxE [Defluviitalea phaphyphila]|uniref:electron transport complex subunit RsxE n=1 Tax=Defluviitalea phaphyphila TaxID=1473580 RepID=UPI000730B16A|nr:electron transport complex subunit E [Defluviitalea phaphyphila]
MNKLIERLKNGIIEENPIFVQVIGMCPTLAVTTGAKNGLGMGLATTAVLVGSNLFISLLRKIIPSKIRIPAYIVIIASLVTMVDLSLQAFIPDLHAQLGLFIPLIVVNCLILARAEAYASKNNILSSILDGLGMGLGFAIALTVLGMVRELLGAGTIFGAQIMPSSYKPALVMILAPGAFFTLGILMAILNHIKNKTVKNDMEG